MGINKTITTYDRIATRYAARAAYPLERELTRFRRMTPTGGLVLDVGCGPGQYTRKLEAQGLRAIGLDLSLGMLCQAQATARPGKHAYLRLAQADMRRLPIAAGRVDGCFVCASLLHLPRTQALSALLDFRRVLRTDGALYVGVKEGEGEQWITTQEGHERFFAYHQPEEIDRLIQAAGFEVVDGWISPPGEGQHHNWINRFAISKSCPSSRDASS
jgi:ubiquinone/menaquinone biosynthesis C-methylase UbiE